MKIIFKNFQSPGDIVVSTGAIRDLKKQYPEYDIRMDTACGAVWELNPHLSNMNNDEADAIFKFDYEDIHNSGKSGRHFSSAFHLTIEKLLKIRLIQSEIWPEIFLSDAEKKERLVDGDYWIVNAGFKDDFPLKSWGHERYQKVVDMLKGKVKFVQVGEASLGHTHIPLDGTINMIGKTSLREYFRLAYQSQGSLGPVSMHLHVSAAFRKPCVIIAGGREPYRWEAYPNQRYLHTNGFLACCSGDGCWKNFLEWQIVPELKEIYKDKVCVRMEGSSAKCMSMITPQRVADEILGYYEGVLNG
ncbi:glycosyltransferase family 9 protein [Sulfuricurvum sp.]|uniref:glycosyltransferase family 9 protein n=1 Tax=Sulfuricurvum sp. TaxID=2025608 RepID=UPI003568A4A1